MATVIIADDHPFTLMGTQAFMENLGYQVLDLCSHGIAACNSILARCPDIALLDMSMPGMNGIEILERLAKDKCDTRVILLTMHNELSIFKRAQTLGVKGYVLKEFAATELEKCLQEVIQGRTWFSPQLDSMLVMDQKINSADELGKLTFSERKIIELIGQQRSTKEIAQLLFITEKTVENHRSSIIKKLKLPPERNALLLWAIRQKEQTD